MLKNKLYVPALVITACTVMGLVDAVIKPGYIIKSIIKILLFLLIPVFYSVNKKDLNINKLFVNSKKGLTLSLFYGVCVYILILSAFLLFRNVFDFSFLTSSLTETTGVNKNNFIYVSIYISFVNSLLEEFFFRGFSYITLKNIFSKKFANIFSSLVFALYHVAMMIGWFDIFVFIIALLGLFVGGLIFNFVDDKYDNIYTSWIIHMFANFSINTIGFILFSI